MQEIIPEYKNNLDFARMLDQGDPLKSFREKFIFPVDKNGTNVIYLCGNSLGLQPISTRTKIENVLNQWATLGVKGHFTGNEPWIEINDRICPLMAKVVGARTEEIAVMNSLTVNLHLMLASFYNPSSARYQILMESDSFPSDKYAVISFLQILGMNPSDVITYVSPRSNENSIRLEDLLDTIDRRGDEIALILIGNTNYYSGQYFDMKEIVRIGHSKGCIVGFDCAHGAGNVPLDLHESCADFAIWCTYKYLNAGPGNLGGVFIHERHVNNRDIKRLSGWWGQSKEDRFKMRDDFIPAKGAQGWQLSNPSILAMSAIEASLKIHCSAGIEAIRKKSIKLTGYLEYLLDKLFDNEINIITPRNPEERGAQLSILIKKDSKKIYNRLIENGAIVDWREPNVIRVSPAALYNSYEDVFNFAELLKKIMTMQNASTIHTS